MVSKPPGLFRSSGVMPWPSRACVNRADFSQWSNKPGKVARVTVSISLKMLLPRRLDCVEEATLLATPKQISSCFEASISQK